MLIYIAGAGAMGCRFGYQLSKAGADVILLDKWQDHINAIRENGLKVTGDFNETVNLPIMLPTEATEEADLVILFTKAMQLKDMLNDIKGVIGENTKVLCLLNGLGHEEVIRQYVPEKNIIMGVTIWTAGLAGPGHAELKGTGTVNLQAVDPSGKEFAEEITALFNKAGLNATYDEDVVPSIWRKACVNGSMNSTCALLDANIGQVFASESGVEIVKEIVHEFVMVANAEGVNIDEKEMIDYVIGASSKVAHHYPSMHQDLVQNNRLTEIDYLNGAVAKKAERLNLQTPYCKFITQLIHTKENILGIK